MLSCRAVLCRHIAANFLCGTQTSYSADGIYVSITLYCLLGGDVYDYEDFTYLSAVFALPKTTLYQNPAPTQVCAVTALLLQQNARDRVRLAVADVAVECTTHKG